MNYWITGVSVVLRKLNSVTDETDSQLSLQVETANNRISDLEAENAKYRKALQIVAKELGLTVDDILTQVEQGPTIATSTDTVEEIVVAEANVPILETKVEVPESMDEDGEEESEESEDLEEVDTSGHFGAVAKYEYNARKNYELSIKIGDVLTVVSKHENGWWLGCDQDGKQGYFPGSYVTPIDN